MKLLSRPLTGLVLFSLLILFGCSASPDYGKYQSQVSSQMQSMINVLNAGHAREFMSTYVNPSYINSMGGLDQAMLQFDNAKQQRLNLSLSFARNIPPIYDEQSRTLTYISNDLAKPLLFKLIGTKWYMDGDWFRN